MVFVFGSNEVGIHGGGAAKVAYQKHGARYGFGVGPYGNSYAIPTCRVPMGRPNCEITLEKIKGYVGLFVRYAESRPDLKFQVTQIGCGLAGWTAEQIAPLFAAAPPNCWFDLAWEPILGGFQGDGSEGPRKYWGTF